MKCTFKIVGPKAHLGILLIVLGLTLVLKDAVEAQTPAPTPSILQDINLSQVSLDLQTGLYTNNTFFVSGNDHVNGRELFSVSGVAAPTLIKDLKSGPGSLNPFALFANNNTLFFRGVEDATGSELYVSTGSAAGTTLLKDFSPGSLSAQFPYFGSIGNTTFVSLERNGNANELWKTDGTTAGTQKLLNFSSLESYFSGGVYGINATTGLFLIYNDNNGDTELWKTDGTTAGTVLVDDVVSSGFVSNAGAAAGGLYYFSVYNYNTDEYEVWTSDGSSAGTDMLVSLEGQPRDFVALGNAAFWRVPSSIDANEKGLWKSLGTVGTTSRIVDLNTIQNLVSNSSSLFFSGKVNGGDPIDLFVSDGSGGGTAALGTAGISNFDELVAVTNGLFFTASTAAAGNELFRSDGTLGGTGLVKDINSGATSSFPFELVSAGSDVFFFANDGSGQGNPLFRSDGTAGGTTKIPGQIISGATDDSIDQYVENAVVGSKVVFPAYDPTPGAELYVTDGTSAGTALIELEPGVNGAGITGLTEIDSSNAAFFAYTTLGGADFQTRLYKTNGTSGGTQAVYSLSDYLKTTYALGFFPGVSIDGNVALGSKFLFSFYDTYGSKTNIWSSDLTSAGTSKIFEADGNFTPYFIGSVGTAEFFSRYNNATSMYELYRTDGSAAGTVKIADLGANDPIETSISSTNNIYFVFNEGQGAVSLRGANASSTSLSIVTTDWDGISNLVVMGSNLVFQTQYSGVTPTEYKLWSTSTATLPSTPSNFASARGNSFENLTVTPNATSLFFVRNTTLYKSDGTSAGTSAVKNFSRESESIFTNVIQFVDVLISNKALIGVYYVDDSANKQTQLWVSDGTEAGTVNVLSLSDQYYLEDVPVAFFSALDLFVLSRNGGDQTGLYETDGTAAGTRLVSEVAPSGFGADIASLRNVNNRLFFSADNRTSGQEPWSYNPDQCPSDSSKGVAGVCGCGVADTDSDSDGTLNCLDQCPSDAAKVAPLVCGCGAAESDTNADGFADCGNTKITPTTQLSAPLVDGVTCKGSTCTVSVTGQKFGSGALSGAASVDEASKGKVTKSYSFKVSVTMSNGKVKRYTKRSSKNKVKIKTARGVTGTSQYRVTLKNSKTGKQKNTQYSGETDFTYPSS